LKAWLRLPKMMDECGEEKRRARLRSSGGCGGAAARDSYGGAAAWARDGEEARWR
jgi:hypothetical protein